MAKINGWNPIETAPEGVLVVVGWLDDEDTDTPERHDFDWKEDGCWLNHEDNYQEFCAVAPPGSRGPKQTAPYTHWLEVPPFPYNAGGNATERSEGRVDHNVGHGG